MDGFDKKMWGKKMDMKWDQFGFRGGWFDRESIRILIFHLFVIHLFVIKPL